MIDKIKNTEQLINGINYIVTLADVVGSKKNKYRVVIYADADNAVIAYSCDCIGAFFKKQCKHVRAVIGASMAEMV